MADATSSPATGTSSTPPAEPAAPTAAATLYPSTTPTQAEPATQPTATDPSKPADTQPSAEPVKADGTPSEPAKAEPAKPTEPAKDAPLFTLPEDFKPPESAVAKFTSAIKGAMVDGKVTLTAQQVVDMYVEQARDANVAWQAQIQKVNTDNEAACKARFTPVQLKASESAVGWFSSFEPAFREFAQRQLNDPVFVNAMRLIGEAMQEDDFLPAAPPGPAKRTPAQRMGYTKPS